MNDLKETESTLAHGTVLVKSLIISTGLFICMPYYPTNPVLDRIFTQRNVTGASGYTFQVNNTILNIGNFLRE